MFVEKRSNIIFSSPFGKQPGDSARLLSPIYNQAGITCQFEFWYQMNGDSIGKINIYLRSGVTESLINTINIKSTSWKRITTSLPTCSNQFQVN